MRKLVSEKRIALEFLDWENLLLLETIRRVTGGWDFGEILLGVQEIKNC